MTRPIEEEVRALLAAYNFLAAYDYGAGPLPIERQIVEDWLRTEAALRELCEISDPHDRASLRRLGLWRAEGPQ